MGASTHQSRRLLRLPARLSQPRMGTIIRSTASHVQHGHCLIVMIALLASCSHPFIGSQHMHSRYHSTADKALRTDASSLSEIAQDATERHTVDNAKHASNAHESTDVLPAQQGSPPAMAQADNHDLMLYVREEAIHVSTNTNASASIASGEGHLDADTTTPSAATSLSPSSFPDSGENSNASADVLPSSVIPSTAVSDKSERLDNYWLWLLLLLATVIGGSFWLRHLRSSSPSSQPRTVNGIKLVRDNPLYPSIPSTEKQLVSTMTPSPEMIATKKPCPPLWHEPRQPHRLPASWLYQPAQGNVQGGGVQQLWSLDEPVDFMPSPFFSSRHVAANPADARSIQPELSEDIEDTCMLKTEPAATESLPKASHEEEAFSTPTGIDKPTKPSVFDRLEALVPQGPQAPPTLLIERDSALPYIRQLASEPPSAALLLQWESAIREAIDDKTQDRIAMKWLLLQTLMLRAEGCGKAEVDRLYAEAAELALHNYVANDAAQRPHWQAQLIGIELAKAKLQKGASRLLNLQDMRVRHESDIVRGEPILLQAWIEVLIYWAQCQYGEGALAKYTEAEALCVHLHGLSSYTNFAQQRRADILRQRAAIEDGGRRLLHLETAQALLDELYTRAPTAAIALGIARIALDKGNVLPPEQAKEAYSHALMHSFLAEADPRWHTEGLAYRLAIQVAYERLPGIAIQGNVAVTIASKLETLPVQQPETLQRIAEVFLRSADFIRACHLCERAWQLGSSTAELLSTWREAGRQWAASLPQADKEVAYQETARQLRLASLMR
jgi:hypothetical protein